MNVFLGALLFGTLAQIICWLAFDADDEIDDENDTEDDFLEGCY